MLDHFQPDCAGCKRPISLFYRMIYALGTFRSARSCSRLSRVAAADYPTAEERSPMTGCEFRSIVITDSV